MGPSPGQVRRSTSALGVRCAARERQYYLSHPGTRACTYDDNDNLTSQAVAGMVSDIVIKADSTRVGSVGGTRYGYLADGSITQFAGPASDYGMNAGRDG
jgi:hypothetical protein